MEESIINGEQSDRYLIVRYLQTINALDSDYLDLKIDSLTLAIKLVHDSVMKSLIGQEVNKLVFADHDISNIDKIESFRNQIITFLK